MLLPLVLFAQPRPTFNVNGAVAIHNSTIPICQGTRVNFINTTASFASIRWRFDKGNPANSFSQVPQVRFDSLGISKAVLIRTDFDGRTDSAWVFFDISNVFPSAGFNYSPITLECGSTNIVFTDASSGNGLVYNWNFGDNQFSTLRNPSHKFSKAIGATGTTVYKITQIVTNSGGCKDTAERDITVKNIPDISLGSGDPQVSFGPFNGVETFRYCNNVPSYLLNFRNNSTTISSNTQYKIKWGDGTPDSTFTTWPSGVSIFHTYPQGNRTLTIEVLGNSGCTNTKTFNIFVGSNPAGGFASPGNTEVCAPDSLKFIISGTANNPVGTVYRVTVNDGSPPLTFNHPAPDSVTHLFKNASCGITSSNGPNSFQNSFFALLNIENPCGATSVNVIPIYVSGKPNPAIGITPSRLLCVGTQAQVRLSGNYGGLITGTGGGNSSCENKGKIIWEMDQVGGYTISNGSRGSRNNSPVNGADWTGGTETFNIVFNTPGTYKIWQFLANDRCGIDSTEIEICVRNPPTASFVMDKKNGCAPTEVTLNNTSPVGPCEGEIFNWNITYADLQGCGSNNGSSFVNGTTATSRNPQVRFGTPGRYIIELTVFARATGCPSATYRDTFFAVAKPKVDIESITGLCAGNRLTPVATTSNCYGVGTPTYLWTFTGGLPATSNQEIPPSISYNANGTFPVSLAVTNGCGTTTSTRNLVVGPRPTANAGQDREVCSGSSIVIGAAPVTGVFYQWTPASGLNNAASANPILTFVYNGPSADTTLEYVVRSFTAPDCFMTDTVLITYKRGPVVTVIPPTATFCFGGNVTLSASGADTYIWSPATGLDATDKAVVVATPTINTTYTVTGSLANGCQQTSTARVNITSRPVVNAGRDTLACNNAPNLTLTGTPAGGSWSGTSFVTSAGIFNPWAAGNGTYTLYYQFTANNCDGIDSMIVTVQNPPNANAGRDTSFCADGSTYLLTGTPAVGSWSGSVYVTSAGSFRADVPGEYDLVYSRGSGSCIGYDTVRITVVNAVSNNTISATQGVCGGGVPAPLVGSNASAGGLALQYQWQSSLDSLSWTNIENEIGKDLVVSSPTQTIFYRRLASTAVCAAGSPSNVVKIFIHPNALANINPVLLVSCPPFNISPVVINLVPYPERNGSYRWFANDNLIGSNAIFPGYTIVNEDDSITIKLVAISAFGCINDTVEVQFKTISNPLPDFTLSDSVGCGPLDITITNITPRAERYTFLWDFGNGQTATDIQPGVITFPVNPSLGDTIYTVVLKATGGCDTVTVEKKIRVRAKPRTLFTPDKAEGCSPFTVTYNNNSAGSNATFKWDFGDGTPRIPAGFGSVSHTYFTGRLDTFRVRLFGTNDCGTDTGRFNLVVNPNRVRLDFAVNGDELNGCAPHAVTFINNTTGANLFRWDFGDGSPVLTTNKGFDTLVHTYTDTGRFVITLFGTNGCSDTTSTEIVRVSDGPKVSFSVLPAAICLGQPFTITNTSEPGLVWNWSFGDGTTSTLTQPVKTYPAAGNYRIILRGTRQFAQGFSCTDSAVVVLPVNAPTGDWRYRGGYYCDGQATIFEVTNSNAIRYRFYFGNGDSLVTTTPVATYTYPQPGTYLPRVVLEYQGCLLTLPGLDSIRMDKNRAGFTSNNQLSCGITRVSFADTSTSFFGIQQWNWLFGDGTSSTLRNPIKTFTQAGSYNVTLRITGLSGCIDSARQIINVPVEQPPVVSINGDTSACVGQLANFSAFDAAGSTSVFDWQIQNGTPQSGVNATNTWQQIGTFQIRLIGRTAFGCADTVFRNIRVHPTPFVQAGNDVTICRGQSTQLNANGGGNSIQWSPVQGLSCANCANPIANPNLTTRYTVTATNSFGCSNRDTMLVNVAQPFNITVTANDTICASNNETAQLFASNAHRYQWNPAVGLSASDVPNPVARPASTTTYRVIGFDAENCFTDTAFVTVAVGYNPTVNLTPGSLVVAGTQIIMQPLLTGGPFSRYIWTPNRDLSCNDCPNPVVTINNNIQYKLEVETIYGCTASDTATYTVQCQQDQVYIPNAFSPDGDGINDILMVRGKGVARVKSFRIFNRFGQVVFEKQNFDANDPGSGWDGRVNGVPASPDVYVFMAEVLCTAGATYNYKGNVTLFR
jgi:gliding motility-associated-like protein